MMPKAPSPSKSYIVGERKWNEIVAELLRTEHEEKDNLLVLQDSITVLFGKTDNPKTLRHLHEINSEATRLIASKIRRIDLLYALLAMREKTSDEN